MKMMKTIDMNADKVKEIIGDSQRFASPFSEPYGYYICIEENASISPTIIQEYLEKLKYMSENIDILIQQAFQSEFYDFYGVNRSLVQSSDQMCRQLVVDSFVLYANDHTIGCYLSNTQFMFGHFIDCLWSDRWDLIYSYIC
ncbi:MAG: hypothetical protein K2O32_15860 [Acetatifactor sp.]|nr:hypothetical protein [Acetatifactor sp.]